MAANFDFQFLENIPNFNEQQFEKTKLRSKEAFNFLTSGYGVNVNQLGRESLYFCKDAGLVLFKGIEFISLCEHHLLPMFGTCHIAYLPNNKILGFGKITEIMEALTKRLQLQERLTQEIGEAISNITQAKGVAVMIEAQHFCMMMQGVEKVKLKVETNYFSGELIQQQTHIFK